MKNLEIDLNRFKHYSEVSQGYTWREQIVKAYDELVEVIAEMKRRGEEPSEELKQELLDLLRATVNACFKVGITEEDFEKHEEKIKNYLDSGKYPRKRGSICHTE